MAGPRLARRLATCGLVLSLGCASPVADPGDDAMPDRGSAEVEALIDQGFSATRSGRLGEALEAFERAERLGESSSASTQPATTADLFYGFGSVYQRLGRLDEARTAARRVEALEARAGAGPVRRAATQLLLARVERLAGFPDRSRQAIARGIELLNHSDDPVTRASFYQERARLLLLDERFADARRELEAAVTLVSGNGAGNIVNDLAEIALRVGDAEGAERLARRALDLATSEAGDSRDWHLEAHAHYIRSRALAQSGAIDAAREAAEAALDRVDTVRLRDASDLGLLFTDMRRDYVRHRLDLAPGATDALDVIERYRARGLPARSVAPVEARRKATENLIDALDQRSRWDPESGMERRDFLDVLVVERRRALWVLADERDEQRVVDTQAAAGLLGGATLALVFGEGVDSVHVLVLDATGRLDHERVIDRAGLTEQVAELVDALAADHDPLALRAEVGRRLLGPVADRLDAFDHLLVVPDGVFAELPLAAIGHPRTGAPLIRTHAISVVPSLSALAAGRRHRSECSPPTRGWAIFGDPIFTSRDSRWPSGVPDVRSANEAALWDRVPGSGAEARELVGLYAERGEGLSALGPRATGARFLDALEHYALIHVASHAEADPVIPERSRILLSCVDASGRPVERCDVYLAAISERALCGPTVILSACETAAGRRVEGEGILGLSRALLRSGAARVVASRWAVPDAETRTLMVEFHSGLIAGRSAAEALNRAAAAAIDRGRGPAVWAAFTVFGDDDPNLFPAPVSLDVKTDDTRRSIPHHPRGDAHDDSEDPARRPATARHVR